MPRHPFCSILSFVQISLSVLLAAVVLTLGGASKGGSTQTLRVGELLALHPTSGTFTVLGYVSKSYSAPPCPQGALCKPSMDANVVLSDEPRRINLYTELGPGDVIVFVPPVDLPRLQIGMRYKLRVDVGAKRSTSLPINDLRLVSADAAP